MMNGAQASDDGSYRNAPLSDDSSPVRATDDTITTTV